MKVNIAASGAYGVATGTKSVTLPTSGTVTFTVPTSGDSVDEADGSVTATIWTGPDYKVGSPSAGTVNIADDDNPPTPVVTISAGSGVTEGTAATFAVTADPKPVSSLEVTVKIASTGDYGVAAATRTVTIPTAGVETFTASTTGDDTHEPDGSVTAVVVDTASYDVGSAGSATVAVSDDDDPPTKSLVTVSVQDASGTEGDIVYFQVLLSKAAPVDVLG